MKFDGRLELAPLADILKRRGMEPGGAVQQYIDSEVLRLNEPYVPKAQDGSVVTAGAAGTKVGSGEVVYNGPYAKMLYYGKVMVGKYSRSAWAKPGEPKETTDKNLTYTGAPQRGAFFFERMKADHKDEILDGARKKAGCK